MDRGDRGRRRGGRCRSVSYCLTDLTRCAAVVQRGVRHVRQADCLPDRERAQGNDGKRMPSAKLFAQPPNHRGSLAPR